MSRRAAFGNDRCDNFEQIVLTLSDQLDFRQFKEKFGKALTLDQEKINDDHKVYENKITK